MKISIGAAYNTERHPLTLRIARSTSETRRDPHSWWEPNIPKAKPRPFRWGPPMRNAPSGVEAELQRVLLQPKKRLDLFDAACWIVAAAALGWLAWAALRGPGY